MLSTGNVLAESAEVAHHFVPLRQMPCAAIFRLDVEYCARCCCAV